MDEIMELLSKDYQNAFLELDKKVSEIEIKIAEICLPAVIEDIDLLLTGGTSYVLIKTEKKEEADDLVSKLFKKNRYKYFHDGAHYYKIRL